MLRPRWLFGICAAASAVLIVFAATAPVLAHPISQGAVKVRVFADHLELEIRVPFEEVVIASTQDKPGAAPATTLEAGLKAHGDYLLSHVHLSADTKTLTGIVQHWSQPAKGSAAAGQPNDERVTYMLGYDLPERAPAQLQISQNVLNEILYAPGNPWEATYIVDIAQENGSGAHSLLLTSKQPISYMCSWSAEPGGAPASAGHWATFKSFCYHGIMHILTGYDHLLFVITLVLAAMSFWDLFKVVGTFTIAHGITLTLSVLNVVRLPERVVEPMIAASIVYVAVENIFFPQRSRSWTRLCAAFFFGLFHGLGFAGGLLEAMEGMPGAAVAVALIAFSVGVEVGHQVVVIPSYGLLTFIRRRQKDEEARTQISDRMRKYASMVISVAGLFYLVTALTAF